MLAIAQNPRNILYMGRIDIHKECVLAAVAFDGKFALDTIVQ